MSTDNTQAAVQAWLDKVEVVTDIALLPPEDVHELQSLLGSRAMSLLLGLMMGSRQGCYLQLANAELATAEGRHNAAVIQGTIRGIVMLPQTLLELAVPAQEQQQAGQEQNP